MNDKVTLQVTRKYSASAKRVFDAWLDKDRLGKWLFKTPNGEMVRVEVDPRVGGKFIVVERRDGQDVEHVGVYVEIERPHRLAFDFSVPQFSSESTRVTIDIVSLPDGCELTLTHSGVLPDYENRTVEGWTGILESLSRTIE